MSKKIISLTLTALVLKAWALDLDHSNLLQQSVTNTQLQQQINSSMATILRNIAVYDAFMTNMTEQILAEHHANILAKAEHFKTTFQRSQRRSVDQTGSVVRCAVVVEGSFDTLAEEINDQIKRCANVAMAEMVNVVSDSLNEAQTFMSIPKVIGEDVQRCGLSNECRWDIVGDAISEAIQVPPKVFALTAKIQSIALRTVVSIDSCGLQGLRKIVETGMGILEDIFECITEENNSVN